MFMKTTSEAKKQFDEQLDGEEIIVISNNHIVVLRKTLIASLLIITVSVVPFSVFLHLWLLWVFLAGFLLSALVFFYNWIGWHFSYFAITNLRVLQVSQKGFFKRAVSEISLDKIQNVNYSVDGLQQHLLHFGTVTIQTYAGDLKFVNIEKPQEFHERLTALINSKKGDSDYPPVVKAGKNG